LFTQRFRRFIFGVKPRKEHTVVPVLDGQYFHTRGVEAIDLASENVVSIVFFTTFHISHAAFDVVFMEPFKTY
jgi:hypothetical protein